MFQKLEGACLCGAVRYRVTAPPIDAAYCHCRICQKSAGAPVVAWLTSDVSSFAYTGEPPAIYRSGLHSQREYCGRCGTQIAFRRIESPATVDVTIASLDDPSRVVPEYHIWRQSRLSWFELADTFPRHDDAGPDCH